MKRLREKIVITSLILFILTIGVFSESYTQGISENQKHIGFDQKVPFPIENPNIVISAEYSPSELPATTYDEGNLQIRIFDLLSDQNIFTSTIKLEIFNEDGIIAREIYTSESGEYTFQVIPDSNCLEDQLWKCMKYVPKGYSPLPYCDAKGCMDFVQLPKLMYFEGPLFDKSGIYKIVLGEDSSFMQCESCPIIDISGTELFIVLVEKDEFSVKLQIKAGIEPENIICDENMILIFRASDGSPVCVESGSDVTLLLRGWGMHNPI